MKYKPADVWNYNFTSQHKLFLDANVWVYLYGPQGQKQSKVNVYSRTFRHILKAKSRIYIDVLALSEFINTYARLKWRTGTPPIPSFKVFRNSQHFKPVAKDITVKVKQILKNCLRIESEFETLEIGDLLKDYAIGGLDFNDQVITELCKSNGFMLITDDRDFKTQEIPILTANRSLLSI
ncbi:PIN domain-containing protein [Candidatus Poribacteria bacterium]|nr:MAG: PIN domain-containing protein [Candidatus Poribacteria bacterium]